MIRAALFDVFGTVVDWRSSIATAVQSRCAAEGVEVGDPYRFADDWRARYDPSMQTIRSGTRPFTRLDILHRENLLEVLADRGVSVSASGVDNLVMAWHSLTPWPDSVAGIERLKTRSIVAPLSNGNVSLLLDMAKNAGIPWDAILGAEVAQAYKPTPEAYLRTADILGLAPQDCMMVAAHNSDLVAATECGFQTAFVLRPREHGSEQTTDLAATGDWDYVVHSIEELAAALDC